MADHSSKLPIYGALAANSGIAIAKFVGGALSGSSAMLSEAIHSLVDSVNELLLLYGLQQSERPPDEQHPLGHGQEVYFWALIVGVLIFGLGGGVSIYEGWRGLSEAGSPNHVLTNYIVLAIAALFEGASLFVAVRTFKKSMPPNSRFWRALRDSKDPATFVVILEDSAALVGIAIAAAGLGASVLTDNSIYDGLASILIGLLLTVVAILLVTETKELLVGESASLETRESVRQIVLADVAVLKMSTPITLHLGPRDILLALNIEFQDQLSSDQIEAAICRLEANIREQHAEIQRIFIEAASLTTSRST